MLRASEERARPSLANHRPTLAATFATPSPPRANERNCVLASKHRRAPARPSRVLTVAGLALRRVGRGQLANRHAGAAHGLVVGTLGAGVDARVDDAPA